MADEWYYEQFENHTRLGMQVRRHLVSERSDFQKIELFEAERYGRVLALDGVYQTSELEEYFYHEMLVHPAMTSAPRIRRALVIGGGDGGTVREVLKHPEVEECVMVEIDARVVEACKAHLPAIGTAWDDPRLELRIGDGIAFVKEADTEPFDVIFLDGSDPIGPSTGLYDEAFYRGCARGARARRRLRAAERIAVPDARHLPPDPGSARPGVRPGGPVLRAGTDLRVRDLVVDLRLARGRSDGDRGVPYRAHRGAVSLLQLRYPPRRLRGTERSAPPRLMSERR